MGERVYELFQSDDFKKDLEKLDKPVKEQVEKAVAKLLENPKRFRGLEGYADLFRLRVGNCRIVYHVKGSQVWLLFVRKRDEDYRFLKR